MFSRSFAAYGVHLFTASGIAIGFLALIAVLQDQKFLAFLFLGLTLIIDGADGALARAVNVKKHTPNIDGQSLDYVIDYVTYALIPTIMIWQWDLVPLGWKTVSCAAILMASTFTFANVGMKTNDGYFVGFPALWNLVVLYLLLFGLESIISLVIIGACLVLTFVPTAYVHPFRVRQFMPITIIVLVGWAISVSLLSWTVLQQGIAAIEQPLWFGVLLITSFYFAAISLYRSFRTS